MYKSHFSSIPTVCSCVSAIMQTSHIVMEQGLKDGVYIDYWQKDEHYLCIRVASVLLLLFILMFQL